MSAGNGTKRKNTAAVKKDETRDTTPLKALNPRQQEYMDAILNESVVICTGKWGTSKTYIPSVMACDELLDKRSNIEKIIIARPSEGKGKSLGYFKGDKNEKLQGWAAPITDTMIKRLGPTYFNYCLENGKIELLALEQVKGRSWDNSFIIIDEAEDLDPSVAKSLVGRQGTGSITVITGDIDQQDIQRDSGLELLLKVAAYSKVDIAIIDFDDWEYCVRSEEAKQWGIAFEKYDKRSK